MTTPILYHATRITRRADRRIMGGPGARENLCGADLTDGDMSVTEFRGCAKVNWTRESNGATACPACRELVTRPEARGGRS